MGAAHPVHILNIPKKVVFLYSWTLQSELDALFGLKAYDAKVGGGGAWKAANFLSADKNLLVVCLPLGGPITAIATEQVAVLGGRDVLIVGAAGGINPSLSIADIVVCKRAIRDEGTSHHYVANAKYAYPNKALTDELVRFLKRGAINHWKGTTWTIDAAFAETKQEIAHYRSQGVMTVEMEAATLFAVARRRKLRAAAVFTISDLLGVKWSGFKEVRDGYKNLARVVQEFKDGPNAGILDVQTRPCLLS